MSSAEFQQLIVEYLHGITSLWEVWLAITFAFIVAFHVGRATITKALAVLSCCIYAAAAASIIMRYIAFVSVIAGLRQSILDAGFEPYTTGQLGVPIYLLTTGTMIFGTCIAIGFAILQFRAINDT